jgi:hypothetical protein
MTRNIQESLETLSISKTGPSSLLPEPGSLPRTASITEFVDSIETNLFVQYFEDTVMVCISQMSGKIGTFLSCSSLQGPEGQTLEYNTSTLLGHDNPIYAVYARQILAALPRSNLILGITLHKPRQQNREQMKAIIDRVIAFCLDVVRN